MEERRRRREREKSGVQRWSEMIGGIEGKINSKEKGDDGSLDGIVSFVLFFFFFIRHRISVLYTRIEG